MAGFPVPESVKVYLAQAVVLEYIRGLIPLSSEASGKCHVEVLLNASFSWAHIPFPEKSNLVENSFQILIHFSQSIIVLAL